MFNCRRFQALKAWKDALVVHQKYMWLRISTNVHDAPEISSQKYFYFLAAKRCIFASICAILQTCVAYPAAHVTTPPSSNAASLLLTNVNLPQDFAEHDRPNRDATERLAFVFSTRHEITTLPMAEMVRVNFAWKQKF